MQKDQYNGAGLMQGQALSEKVLYESGELICYEDRALHKYNYKAKYPQTVEKQIKRFLSACPELEQLYVLPVPPRICTEMGGFVVWVWRFLGNAVAGCSDGDAGPAAYCVRRIDV